MKHYLVTSNLDDMPKKSYFMQMWIFLLIILCSGWEVHAQSYISDPVSITSGDNSYGKRSPRIALNGNDDLVVFWMRTGNEGFFFSTYEDGQWTAPTEIPIGTINANLWSGSLGPGFASSGNHMYVTFEVYGDAIYTVHSGDNGLTWDAPVYAFTPPQGRRATIPSIACDALGNPYVAYINTNASESDAHYGMVRSMDYGATYLDEVIVNENALGAEVCECCNGHIDIAPNGDVYMAFRNNNANLRDIWLAKSTDGAASFSSAFDMDETDWVAGVCPSNGPHFFAENDRVVSTFFSGSSDWGAGAYLSSLDVYTGTVSPTQDIPLSDPVSYSQNYPKVAGHGDSLAIVWQETYNGSIDIAMNFSTTGPDGLMENSFRITEAAGTQSYPQLIMHQGSYHVVYEDAISGTVMYQEIFPGSLGLSESRLHELNVFPNPSAGSIKLDVPFLNPMNIVIHDFQGRLVDVASYVIKGNSLDLSTLSDGMYTLTLNQGKEIWTGKVVLMK